MQGSVTIDRIKKSLVYNINLTKGNHSNISHMAERLKQK